MKKGTRLLIAGILGIAVSSASTLAYFTSTATVSPNGGQAPLALNITNGTVVVSAAIGDGLTPTWTYDVARSSTSSATYLLYTVIDDQLPAGIDELDTGYVANYVIPNRSKDIGGISAANIGVAGAETGRYAVGAPVTGAITNARPGDALVLGLTGAGTEGINVKNDSTLTVKLKILAKTDQATTDKIAALAAAGWKMYVNGNATDITDTTTLQAALNSATTTLAPGASLASPITVRLELPLLTADGKQGAVLDASTDPGTQAFDVSSLFTIMATQENNPGYSDSGN